MFLGFRVSGCFWDQGFTRFIGRVRGSGFEEVLLEVAGDLVS